MKDFFHEAVKNALQKENWLITDDPLHLDMGTAETKQPYLTSWQLLR